MMKKGYQLIEPIQLNDLFSNPKYFEFAVLIFHWLISQLHIELKEQLIDVHIEVVRVTSHIPSNSYPALGVYYEKETINDLGPLIEATIKLLLEEWPIIDLVTFIGVNRSDWKLVTKNIIVED